MSDGFLYNPNDLLEALIFHELGVNKPSKEINVKLLSMTMGFFTQGDLIYAYSKPYIGK